LATFLPLIASCVKKKIEIGLVDGHTQPILKNLEILYDGYNSNKKTTQLKAQREYLTILRKGSGDRRGRKFENGFSRPDGCTPCKGGQE